MAKGILKAARNFDVEVFDEEGARRVQWAAGTLSPRSLKYRNFEKKKKLEEVQPMSYKLSYWTLRFNENATNEEYLVCQREDVETHAKYLLIAHATVIGIVLMLLLAYIEEDEGIKARLAFLIGLTAPATIFLGIVHRIARYKRVCFDLLGVVYLSGYVFSLVTLSF